MTRTAATRSTAAPKGPPAVFTKSDLVHITKVVAMLLPHWQPSAWKNDNPQARGYFLLLEHESQPRAEVVKTWAELQDILLDLLPNETEGRPT